MTHPRSIVYYRTSTGSVPFDSFLNGCPPSVEATILATPEAVAEAPPPQFSGGGGGLYEKYTVGSPTIGGGPLPRSGWGGYFVGSAAMARW